MKVDISKENEQYKVSLTAIPINGNIMYADSSEYPEHIAFSNATKKIKRQMEKYKELHYNSSTKNRPK